MNNIKKIITEQLLLEKRIGQISSQIKVDFGFDIIKTKHAEKRKDPTKRYLSGMSSTHISNAEMVEFVRYFKREIAEGLATEEIEDQVEFIIRSEERELAMVIIPEHVSGNYWKLIIKTLFRESDLHNLRVGFNQVVYEK
jgi:hypothetical protein